MKNLIHTAIVTLFAASAAQAQQAVQWKVSDGGNGHWYVLHPTTDSWPALRTISESLGGHLVTLNTIQEWSWVKQNFEIPFQTGRFVGGFQDRSAADFVEPGGGWRWVTGEPFMFDLAYMAPFDDFCENQQVMYFYGCCNQFLSDIQNGVEPGCDSYLRQAIFEWSVDCNSDGIVDYGQCHDGTLPDYDGNNVPDCCERGEACVVGNYPVQWRIEDGGNGHWYQGVGYATQGVSWTAAREDASIHGAELVTFESLAESSWVFSAIVAQESMWNLDCGPWVGAYQSTGSVEPSGGWIWVDGTPVGSTFNWAASQPDDARNCGGDNNRMHYWRQGSAVPINLLADAPDAASFTCDQGYVGIFRSAVLEWSADCNNDGVVDYGQILQGQLVDANTNGIPDICEGPTCNDIDLNLNGIVDGGDLGVLLAFWGPVSPAFPRADINKDGFVNGADLGIVLAFWGPCTN